MGQEHSSYHQWEELVRLKLVKRDQAMSMRRIRAGRKSVVNRRCVVIESRDDEGETQVQDYRIQTPQYVHSDGDILCSTSSAKFVVRLK